jgi:hypothetical protein
MGRLLLVWRLVLRSIRQRPVEALLSVVAIAGATTTLALGLALYGVSSHPYDTTRTETAGPDIVAQAGAFHSPIGEGVFRVPTRRRALAPSIPSLTPLAWSPIAGRSP